MSATNTQDDEPTATIPRMSDIETERQREINALGETARAEALARALDEIESIGDESDDLVDWEEAERDLDSFRPERKLFTVRNR
jgi:hypothetical protein